MSAVTVPARSRNRRAGLWGADRPTEPGHCRDDYDTAEHRAWRLWHCVLLPLIAAAHARTHSKGDTK